jgi:RHS repeat-associated protein
MVRYTGLLLCAVVMLASFSGAQVAVGTPPFATIQEGVGSINIANLNSHLQIPVIHRAGRGVPLDYDLSYDSSVWTVVTVGSTKSWTPATNWGWGGALQGTGLSGQVTYNTATYYCYLNGSQYPTGGGQITTDWAYYETNGTKHTFSGGTNVFGSGCSGTQVTSFTSTASDGSGLKLNGAPNGGTVTTRSGIVLNSGLVGDTNGNYVGSNTSGVFTDTLGNTNALSITGSSPNPVTFTFAKPGPIGTTASVIVTYKQYTIKTNFGCSPTVGEYGPANNYLVDKVQLADGSYYQFAYEPTPGFAGDYTGRIKTITLPTGGQISYTYTGSNNGIVCSDGSAAGLTRVTPDGTWTYTRTAGSGAAWTTVVNAPDNAQTRYQFQGIYQTKKEVFQGTTTSGPILQTVDTCYNGNVNIATCTSTPVALPITSQVVWNTLPSSPGSSSGVRSRVDTIYNVLGLPTQVAQYDYAPIGSGNSVIQVKSIGYASLSNGIADRVSSISVTDGTNQLSQTTYGYDENTVTTTSGTPSHNSVTGSRGNLTSVHHLVGGSTTLNQSYTYYDTGLLNVATDVNGATTTYKIGANTALNCGNSFPVEVDLAISTLIRYMAWDCVGGVQTQFTDENGKITQTKYYDTANTPASDPYYRPIYSTDALLNNFTYYYAPTSFESKMLFNSPNSVVDYVTTFDSQGRPRVSQRRQSPNSPNYDSTEIDYDLNGRAWQHTLPYQATLGQLATSPKDVTTHHDGAGRPSEVDDPAGGWTKYSYYSNDTYSEVGPQVGTENTKRKQLEYDALGRLSSVCEITSASGSGSCAQSHGVTGYWTKYAYAYVSSSQNKVTVTQNAQSGTVQTRTYFYDKASRLVSQVNPENGTTAYVYDTDSTCGTSTGDLVKKTDAVGNVTCYAYDSLHRLKDVTYPSGSYSATTDQKHYVWDTATVNGVQMSNTKGRLAEAYTGPSTGKKTDFGFSYSDRGEATDVYQSTPNSGGYYHVTNQYWANGALNSISGIPGIPTLTYGVDGEGRSSTVSASSGQNPVTAVSYNVNNQVTALTLGSLDTDAFTYDPNSYRMTQFKFNIGTTPTTLQGDLTWNANGTFKQLIVTDGIVPANSQTCTYGHDDLVRVVSVSCGSAWAQTFSFDAFGNLSKSGSANWLPTYNSPTNQYLQIPGGPSGLSNYYDANGNVKNDLGHTYGWDANGNMLSVDSTSVTAIYDAFDRMVEQTRGSTHQQILYSPRGKKLALMNGQALVTGYVRLPGGGKAIYKGATQISYVQSANNTTASGTSVAKAFTSSTAAGNTIVVFVRVSSSTADLNTPTDTQGNTYHLAVNTYQATGARRLAIFYAFNITGGPDTVTATSTTSGTNLQIAMHEYSGILKTADPLDQTVGTAGAGPSNPTSGTVTTTQTNELIFGACTDGVFTYTAGSGFTLRESLFSTTISATEDKIVSSTGTYSASCTQSSATNWIAAIATFKAGGGLSYYRHSDWLGSSRLASTPSRTKYYDVAYAPYGEEYNGSGTQDLSFTDQEQDTISGGWTNGLYDFQFREYRASHGRWISPDRGGLGVVDPTNPQSWNRYAYVLNNPLTLVDPLGLEGECYDDDCGYGGGPSNGIAGDSNRQRVPDQQITVSDGWISVGTLQGSMLYSQLNPGPLPSQSANGAAQNGTASGNSTTSPPDPKKPKTKKECVGDAQEKMNKKVAEIDSKTPTDDVIFGATFGALIGAAWGCFKTEVAMIMCDETYGASALGDLINGGISGGSGALTKWLIKQTAALNNATAEYNNQVNDVCSKLP